MHKFKKIPQLYYYKKLDGFESTSCFFILFSYRISESSRHDVPFKYFIDNRSAKRSAPIFLSASLLLYIFISPHTLQYYILQIFFILLIFPKLIVENCTSLFQLALVFGQRKLQKNSCFLFSWPEFWPAPLNPDTYYHTYYVHGGF